MKVVLQGVIETDFDSINRLMFVDRALSDAVVLEECIIDMQRVTWFNAALCSFFKAFLRRRMLENNISIRFLFNDVSYSNMAVRDILFRNGFFNGEVSDVFNTIFPVRTFRASDLETENFLRDMKVDFQDKEKFPFSETASRGILKSLGEIFSNSERHAESDWVYTSGQYFPNKEPGQVTFCIADVGIGIVNQVKTKLGRVLDSDEAIEWAFVEGNTTKENSGGLGLFSLKNIISDNKGELIVVSNDVYYDVLKQKMFKLSFDFKGTLFIITMNQNG